MKTELLELPVTSMEGFESPSITALHAQGDGSVLCGLMFASPCLFRVKAGGSQIENLWLETELGKGLLGVINGLRSNTSGDTAFATLHEGFAPGFIRGLAGGDLRGKRGPELHKYLAAQDGGLGVSVRHSLVQLREGKIIVRRYREPGALLDAAHIGDFVFGLYGSGVWREPYLNPEKREVLRKDLEGNRAIHRDNEGKFWFEGQNGRLLRMGQTDIKAKPTPLKLPDWKEGHAFEMSAASVVDEWLYGVCGDSKILFRVRVNPVTQEEEMQTVAEFEKRITAITVCRLGAAPVPAQDDHPLASAQKALLVLAFEGAEGAEIWAGELIASEDPEMIGPKPELTSRGRVAGVEVLGSLTWDGSVLWAGEGRLGEGGTAPRKPRLVKITEFLVPF